MLTLTTSEKSLETERNQLSGMKEKFDLQHRELSSLKSSLFTFESDKRNLASVLNNKIDEVESHNR